MKHLNTNVVYVSVLLIIQALLLQACSTDVGGNEDNTKPVVTLTSLNGGEEVIGEYTITWDTDEQNRSTVEIDVSHNSGDKWRELEQDNIPEEGIHDTGSFEWDSNGVEDCRTCRVRITPTDIVGNVGEPAVSEQDFIINNVPQVVGAALFTDATHDGASDGDTIKVAFDKNVEILTSIASDIFFLPVLGDSIGPFATVAKGDKANELEITINNVIGSEFHIHARGVFNNDTVNRTAPTGLNILDNLAEGILVAKDNGRTAAPSEAGIDAAPGYSDFVHFSVLTDIIRAAAVGDINNDGYPDLVHGVGGTLTIFHGGVGGLLTHMGDIITGADASSILLADLNNDRDQDILLRNALMENDGSGNFIVINGIGGEVVGDINGDNYLDVASSSSLLINNKNMTFTDAGISLDAHGVGAPIIGDIDGDNDMDIIAGNSGGRYLWMNDGAGNMTDMGLVIAFNDAEQVFVNVAMEFSAFLVDVDNDGDIDYVDGNNIWHNDGSGAFAYAGQPFDIPSRVADMGDIDGDSDADAAVISIDQFKRIYFNDGNGGFTNTGQRLNTFKLFGGVDNTTLLELADADADGDLDLVTAGLDRGGEIWYNSMKVPGKILLNSKQALGVAFTSNVLLSDVDSDSDLDLISVNIREARLWVNDGVAEFADSGLLVGDNSTLNIIAGDVDNDNDQDVILINTGDCRVWSNDGTGVFTDSGMILGDGNTLYVVLGDIDKDGDADFIESSSVSNRLWLNNGNGVFSVAGLTLLPGDVDIYDVDMDGDLDIISGTLWLNNNEAEFHASNFVDTGSAVNIANILLWGNFDNERGLDFIATDFTLFNYDGEQNDYIASGAVPNPEIVTASTLTSGDINGDGFADIIVGAFIGEIDTVLLNDGDGIFFNSGVLDHTPGSLNDTHTNSITLGDLDGDGDLDAVFARGHTESQVVGRPNRVWLNDY